MEFRKIKKVLTEDATETVEKSENSNGLMTSYEAEQKAKKGSDEYREAILSAVRSENDAISEYDGILKMEEQTEDKELVKLFHDDIVHIRDEEKAHFQMLTEKLSKIPGFNTEKEIEAKKESVLTESISIKEDVTPNRTYSLDTILDVMDKVIPLTTETYDSISDLFIADEDEVEASKADEIIATVKERLGLSDLMVSIIEKNVNETQSPAEARIEDFNSDLDADILNIENTLASDEIRTLALYTRLVKIKDELKTMRNTYNGDKNTTWTVKDGITHNKKVIA